MENIEKIGCLVRQTKIHSMADASAGWTNAYSKPVLTIHAKPVKKSTKTAGRGYCG